MPYHLLEYNVSFNRIELNIPRASVNAFLGKLWDEFNQSIGRVACFHNYLDTDSPEVYEYNICWSDRDLPFTAELSFYNHTAKGLTYLLLAAVEFETKKQHAESEERILDAIRKTLRQPLDDIAKPSAYVQIPIKASCKLSGNYKFPQSHLLICGADSGDDAAGYITFPVCATNPTEKHFESAHRSLQIASILTTLTQQRFYVDDQATWKVFDPNLFDELWGDVLQNGGFVEDSGFLVADSVAPRVIDLSEPTNEIIEEDDCVINDRIHLPKRTDELIAAISSSGRFVQSCSRFSEGLDIRGSVKRSINKIYLISYELIAYVSAIEAMLETSREKIDLKCPSCGELISKEEWKISEKFREFVDKNTEGNPVLGRAFKELYNDRSKFVHTGINLHNFLAHRPCRPAILLGKRHLRDTPDYYLNIHEYTGYLLRRYLYRKFLGINKE